MNPEETILKDINNTQQIIAIPLEEYKELLIIKGKYEELKQTPKLYYSKDDNQVGPQYKITC
jgi:hypothetical protein